MVSDSETESTNELWGTRVIMEDHHGDMYSILTFSPIEEIEFRIVYTPDEGYVKIEDTEGNRYGKRADTIKDYTLRREMVVSAKRARTPVKPKDSSNTRRKKSKTVVDKPTA